MTNPIEKSAPIHEPNQQPGEEHKKPGDKNKYTDPQNPAEKKDFTKRPEKK